MWWLLACSSADPDPAVPLDAAALEVLTELERSLRLADEVLRFKIVVRGEAA